MNQLMNESYIYIFSAFFNRIDFLMWSNY